MIGSWVVAARLFAPTEAAIELQWDAPEGCPDAGEVVARTRRWLGDAPSEPIRVRGQITARADGRWRLELRVADGPAREIVSTSCEGLAEAAAVVVAIAIAPEAMAEHAPLDVAVPEAPAPPAHAPTALPSADPRPATSSRRRTRGAADREGARDLRGSLRVLAGAGLGPVPIGADLAFAAALVGPRWRVELSADYAPPRRVSFDDLADSGAQVSAWAIGPRGCGTIRARAWLRLPLCVGVELGQLGAKPFGLVNARPQTHLWAAAIAAIGLQFVVHRRVALWLAPEAVIGLTPARVTADGGKSRLFQTAPVGMRALGGIELFFL